MDEPLTESLFITNIINPTVNDGTITAPSISFASEPGTGFSLSNPYEVTLSIDQVGRFSVSENQADFNVAGISLTDAKSSDVPLPDIGKKMLFSDIGGHLKFKLTNGTIVDLGSTTNITEGTNLYFTTPRARSVLSTTDTNFAYDSSTGVMSFTLTPNFNSAAIGLLTIGGLNGVLKASTGVVTGNATTTDLLEGINLYYTQARFDTAFAAKTTTGLAEGSNLYYTQARFDTAFALKTTSGLAEGTNLYYTDARARLAFSISGANLTYNNVTGVYGFSTTPSFSGLTVGTLSGVLKATAGVISGSATTDDLPVGASNLYFTNALFDTRFATKTTSGLAEGTNLYYTDARARLAVSGSGNVTYNSVSGVFGFTATPTFSGLTVGVLSGVLKATAGVISGSATTDDLPVGVSNLYFTNALFDTRFATKTTDNLPVGVTNLYFTNALFDARFATKTTTNLAEGSNLYYTDARARLAVSISGTNLTYNNVSGVFGFTTTPTFSGLTIGTLSGVLKATAGVVSGNATTDDLPVGTTNLYFTNTLFDTRFATKTTTNLAEGSNLYYTDARARLAVSISGSNLTYNNVSGVFGFIATPSFSGLTIGTLSGVLKASAGVVSGSATTDDLPVGVSNLYFTNTLFDTRFATKTTSNLAEGTNLYYTDARARLAVSAGAGIGYNSTTGVITANMLSVTGTANQVLVNGSSGSAQTGAVTLTLPQSIATSSTVQFGSVGIGGSASVSLDIYNNTAAYTEVVRIRGNYSVDGYGSYISFRDSAPTEFNRIGSIREAASVYGLAFNTYSTTLAERVRINGAGHVGIGLVGGTIPALGITDDGTKKYLTVKGVTASSVLQLLTGQSTTHVVGDIVGQIEFGTGQNSGGTPNYRTAMISSVIDNTSTLNQYSGSLAFYTTQAPTGSNSLLEKMRITNAGFLGVGTSSPASILHVSSATSGGGIAILEDKSTGSANIELQFRSQVASLANASKICGSIVSAPINAGGRLVFNTSNHTTGILTERIRIDEQGKVGIGTSLASNLLTLANNQFIAWRNNANSSETVGITSSTADDMQLYVGGTRVTILSSGYVGVGTSSPEDIFHVAKAGAGITGARMILDNTATATTGNACEIMFLTDATATSAGYNANIKAVADGSGTGYTALTFGTYNGVSTERMRITPAGYVGIGGIPNGIFHIKDTVNSAAWYFQGTLGLGELVGWNGTTYNPLAFRSQAGTQLYLDTSGRVGVGTSAPEDILHVAKAGSGTIGARIILDNTATVGAGNACEVMFLTDAGSTSAGYNANIKAVEDGSGVGYTALTFGTYNGTSTEKVRITPAGYVGIGTSSPTSILHVSNAQFGLFVTNSDYVATSAGSGLYIQTGASSGNTHSRIQAFQLGNSAVQNLVLNQFGGNVGVGMVPTNTLDVTGTLGITGASILGGAVTNSALTASSLVYSNASKVLSSVVLGSGLTLTTGTLANSGVLSITGTANQVIASAATGAITLSLPQDIATISSPSFTGVTVSGSTANSLIYSNASKALASVILGANITLTAGTLDTIQAITTSSSPSFTGVTVSGSTANSLIYSNGSKALSSVTLGSGLTLTTGTLANSGVLSITGTANQVIASASTGAVTLSLPQSIDSSANVQFGSVNITGSTSVNLDITNNTAAYTEVIRIRGNYSVNGYGSYISFRDTTPTEFNRIGSIREASAVHGLAFSTYNSALTERVRISGAGHVGIGLVGETIPALGITDDGTKKYLTVKGVTASSVLQLLTGQTVAHSSGDIVGQIEFGTGQNSGGVTPNYRTAMISSVIDNVLTATQYGGSLAFYTTQAPSGSNVLSEKMRITNSGAVGIGISSPSGSLHINGNSGIYLTNTDFATLSAGSGAYIQTGATSGNTYTQIQAFQAGNSATQMLVLNPNGGNVSIGNTTSTRTFQVKTPLATGSLVGNRFCISDFSSATLELYQSTTENQLRSNIDIGLSANNSTTSMLYVMRSGSVGVGTVNPSALLDVSGFIRTTGLTSTPSSGKGLEFLYHPVNDAGYFQAYDRGTSAYKPLNIDSSTLLLNNTSGGKVAIGTGSAINLLVLANNKYMTWRNNAGSSESVGLISTTADDLQFYVNGTRMTLLSSGFVGVGVSPLSRFHVAGPANDWTTRLTAPNTSSQSYGLLITAGTTSTDTALQVLDASSTNTYLRLMGNGNFGIGTSNPEDIFHVVKSNAGGTGARLLLDNPAATTTNNACEIAFILDGTASGSSYNANIKAFMDGSGTGYAALIFGTYGGASAPAERMRISPSGNVGIGETSPDVKLVSRNTAVTAQISARYDGTLPANYKELQLGYNGSSGNGYGWLQAVANGVAYTPLSLQLNGGYVGIGTTNPQNILHVSAATGGTAVGILEDRSTGAADIQLQFRSQYAPLANGSKICSSIIGAPSNTGGRMIFYTAQNTTGTLTERMRIDDVGYITFGTGSTGMNFGTTDSSTGFWIRNDGSNTVISTKNGSMYYGYGGASGITHFFYSGVGTPSETMRITSGLVSVGGTISDTVSKFEVIDTNNLGITVNAPTPRYNLYESDAALNEKWWDYLAISGTLSFRVINDAQSASANWMVVDRTATTVDSVTFPNGNVSVGTTVPGTKFHVAGDANITSNWKLAQLRIGGLTNSNYQLNMGYDTTNNQAVIQAGEDGTAYRNLCLNPNGGSVGIGSTSFTAALHVATGGAADNTNYGNAIQTVRPTTGAVHIAMVRQGARVWGLGYVYNSNNFAIFNSPSTTETSNTSPAFSIDTFNNAYFASLVGIGVAPSFPLHVKRSSNPQIVIDDNSGGTSEIQHYVGGVITSTFFATATNVTLRSVTSIPLNLGAGNNNYMTILPSGFIGIGISPSYLLHLAGSQTNTVSIMFNQTTTATGTNANMYGLIHYSNLNFVSGTTNFGTGQYLALTMNIPAATVVTDATSVVAVQPTNSGAGSVTRARTLQVAAPAVGTSCNIATWTENISIGSGYFSNTPPTYGAIIQGNVGIGCTSFNNALQIATGGSTDTGSYGKAIQTVRPTTSAVHLAFVRQGSWVWGLGFLYNSNNFAIFNSPNATETSNTTAALSIDTFSNASFAGNVTITGVFNAPLSTPASSSATGTTGQIKWDGSFIYVCTATNTWKRVALSTF